MKTLCWMSVLAVMSAGVTQAQANPQLLKQLDDASAKFQHAQADVKYDFYTRVVKEHDLQTGSIYIERGGGGENMGALFFDSGNTTPAKVINYTGGTLLMYSPGTKQVDIFKAGANQAKYESFLTLGFGGSGADLQKAWTIQDQGPETIEGVKTEKLDLVSKEQSVRDMVSHVTIWVDPARGVSLKQIFFQPNGDSRTAMYSNIRLIGTINKKPYAIDPKANKIQH
jgi:outer membrane lipoprotein-sorting protein